ncbi:MAG: response regulator [bacterium]
MKGEKRIRVLIVEDEYLVGEMVKGVLEEAGFLVIGEASNGAEAVESTSSLKPDVVLMDIQMPDLDGLEATRRIQQSCPTPVVILTAHDSKDLIQEASAAGVGAYLLKPPNAREVRRAITIATARFDDMMELRRLNTELKEALAHVHTLRGMLPICAHCKKIRDDQGYWRQVEEYIRKRSQAEFTHSICPDCAKKYYSQFLDD